MCGFNLLGSVSAAHPPTPAPGMEDVWWSVIATKSKLVAAQEGARFNTSLALATEIVWSLTNKADY